jgi:hypothetical protein
MGRATILGTESLLPMIHAKYAVSYAACLMRFDDSHVDLGRLGTAIITFALAEASAT